MPSEHIEPPLDISSGKVQIGRGNISQIFDICFVKIKPDSTGIGRKDVDE